MPVLAVIAVLQDMEQRIVKCLELLDLHSIKVLHSRGACRPGGLLNCTTILYLLLEFRPSLFDRNPGYADTHV